MMIVDGKESFKHFTIPLVIIERTFFVYSTYIHAMYLICRIVKLHEME